MRLCFTINTHSKTASRQEIKTVLREILACFFVEFFHAATTLLFIGFEECIFLWNITLYCIQTFSDLVTMSKLLINNGHLNFWCDKTLCFQLIYLVSVVICLLMVWYGGILHNRFYSWGLGGQRGSPINPSFENPYALKLCTPPAISSPLQWLWDTLISLPHFKLYSLCQAVF